MDRLRELALRPGWTYEVVVSTLSDGVPHSAPMGVRTEDETTVRMEIFDGSQTLNNILATGCFVVNFPSDTCMLFTALFAPDKLAYGPDRGVWPPVLDGCCASVDAVLSDATKLSDRVRVTGTVEETRADRSPRLINRAEGLLVESLILATRLHYLHQDSISASLAENYRVIRKVAPGSPHEANMSELLRALGLPS
ncbi:MAG: DUF447 domain-containing protein [bacterium]